MQQPGFDWRRVYHGLRTGISDGSTGAWRARRVASMPANDHRGRKYRLGAANATLLK